MLENAFGALKSIEFYRGHLLQGFTPNNHKAVSDMCGPYPTWLRHLVRRRSKFAAEFRMHHKPKEGTWIACRSLHAVVVPCPVNNSCTV